MIGAQGTTDSSRWMDGTPTTSDDGSGFPEPPRSRFRPGGQDDQRKLPVSTDTLNGGMVERSLSGSPLRASLFSDALSMI